MQRRKFIEIAGYAGAGLGIGAPAFANTIGDGNQSTKLSSPDKAATLAIPLDGEWQIATDAKNIGREEKWFTSVRPGAKTVKVPSIIQEPFPAYHGVAWYWKQFEPWANPYPSGRCLVRFDAVDYLAEVWLNGTYLGKHEGGETPFEFDATASISPGKTNILAVQVLNPNDERIDGITLAETPHRNKVVKYRNGSLPDYGGIIEPVALLLVPAVRITDVFARPDWKTGKVPLTFAIQNTLKSEKRAHLQIRVCDESMAPAILTDEIRLNVKAGTNEVSHEIQIKDHRLWDIVDPCLYRIELSVSADGVEGTHGTSFNCGFRDFRVVNGYFRLNGRRIFLRSTHTGNHCPVRAVAPPDGFPDMLRKDLLYAKACGYNTIRFDFGTAHPYQLDLCDELGLMVYEESSAGWNLKDSPQMKTRYENSMRDMVLRDRNHPSIVMWGMLNETVDGPIFFEAVHSLPLMRKLDETRLTLLSSGRFDGHLDIGSTSNPGTEEWQPTWGKENPGAAHIAMDFPSGVGSGDFHLYPKVPQTASIDQLIRKLGEGTRPVFLSEYGIGSMMDVIHEARMFEQAGVPADSEDYVMVRSMADRFSADWIRFGMDAVYPFPETMLQRSQESMVRHRLVGFNAIRSNPNICGYNLTGMLDHAYTGEGIWRFWRDWKPGAFDAMQDGWAPVRWCLFAEPTHTYLGRPVTLEAVLANEDALRFGEYRVRFQAWGPDGLAWQQENKLRISSPAAGEDGPLAIPAVKEDVVIKGPAGDYEFVPYAENGIAPPETSWQFHLTDPASLPRLSQKVSTWGIPAGVESWLNTHGVFTSPFHDEPSGNREVILIGDVSSNASADFYDWQAIERPSKWKTLAERMATGNTVVFLSPHAFKVDNNLAARLPLAKKGRIYEFWDWLYHKECVAKRHPVFEGLQAGGLLDWYYYGPMIPSFIFDGQETPTDVIAATFAAGYSTPGGYASGVLLGSYQFGAGQFFINSFPILENIDKHPVADRLLLNLIQHCGDAVKSPATVLPEGFAAKLREIGYSD